MEASWGVLGRLGNILWCPGEFRDVLGASWEYLGPSLERLAASWAVLGRHVGVLGASWRYLVPDFQAKVG